MKTHPRTDDILLSTKHLWSFTAKQHGSTLLKKPSIWGLVLKCKQTKKRSPETTRSQKHLKICYSQSPTSGGEHANTFSLAETVMISSWV